MVGDVSGGGHPANDDAADSLRSVDAGELRFLQDEGLEFLAACRAIRAPVVRRSILDLLRALAAHQPRGD